MKGNNNMEKETATIEEVQAPKADWNHWSLLEATKPGMPHRAAATELCKERLRALTETPVAFVCISNGCWGRGKSLSSAAAQCNKAGARKSSKVYLYMVENDEKPEVSSDGTLIANSEGNIIRLGGIRTLGALME